MFAAAQLDRAEFGPIAAGHRGSRFARSGIPEYAAAPLWPWPHDFWVLGARGCDVRGRCGVKARARHAASGRPAAARGGLGVWRAALDSEPVAVDAERAGCCEGRSARPPRASGEPGPRDDQVSSTPQPRQSPMRAGAGCEVRADQRRPVQCGVSENPGRAASGRPGTARGDVDDQRALLDFEPVLVDNESMGRYEGSWARTPRAPGEPDPRGLGVPSTPHVATSHCRAAAMCVGRPSAAWLVGNRDGPAERGVASAGVERCRTSGTGLRLSLARRPPSRHLNAGALGRPAISKRRSDGTYR